MTPISIGVSGATGRMGAAVLRLAGEDPALQVVAACTRRSDVQGIDAGARAGGRALGVALSEQPERRPAIWIDFTNPQATEHWAGWCAENNVALVCGTTGLEAGQHAALLAAARRVAVLWAPNMSVGVQVLRALVEQAARTLGPGWDIEISETHHSRKLDAPSGTAKLLLEAARAGRPDADRTAHGRTGVAQRSADEIGMHALRLGGVVGDHSVHFGSAGEVITLSHRALSRDVFALGALQAAKWLAGRAAGMYSMADVCGL